MKEIGKVSRREFIGTTAAVGACMCGLNGCNILLPKLAIRPRFIRQPMRLQSQIRKSK